MQQEIYTTVWIGLFFIILLVSFIIITISIYEKRRRIQETVEKMLEVRIEAQEQAFKTISQEIHDNLGQALSLTKLNLNTMHAPSDEVLQRKIWDSKQLVSKAIVDLRDLSRSLDTDYVQELGLQRAIEYELDMIRKTGIMQSQITVSGNGFRFNKQKELILFRIVQESINNVIKHANAKNINISIHYQPTSFALHITDDGQGLDESHSTGLGIRNMHSRAKLIGADFSINSTLGKGTEVSIVLPKENGNHENKQ